MEKCGGHHYNQELKLGLINNATDIFLPLILMYLERHDITYAMLLPECLS